MLSCAHTLQVNVTVTYTWPCHRLVAGFLPWMPGFAPRPPRLQVILTIFIISNSDRARTRDLSNARLVRADIFVGSVFRVLLVEKQLFRWAQIVWEKYDSPIEFKYSCLMSKWRVFGVYICYVSKNP
jgi:hypothetical protein